MYLVFQESNFYNAIATFYYDLVIFGTATMLIYEDFHNVINCYNPCAGEYYVDIDGRYWPSVLYREFTMTVFAAVVDEFGYDNCSATVRELYDTKTSKSGSNLTREIIVAHAIELTLMTATLASQSGRSSASVIGNGAARPRRRAEHQMPPPPGLPSQEGLP